MRHGVGVAPGGPTRAPGPREQGERHERRQRPRERKVGPRREPAQGEHKREERRVDAQSEREDEGGKGCHATGEGWGA